MKINRTGAERNAGTFTLVSEDLTEDKIDDVFGQRLRWKADSKELAFRSRGEDRNISYNYEVTLTLEEIIRFVTLAVQETSKDTASRAIGKSAITALRELLVEKILKSQE